MNEVAKYAFGVFAGVLFSTVVVLQAQAPVQQHPYQPSYHPLAINAW